MSEHAQRAFPAAAIFALALSAPFASPIAASAAETCLEAPKGAGPAGSHWKYRLERGTQRKCWRLVQADRKAVAAKAAPQSEGDDDEEATPAPAAPAPVAKRAVKSAEVRPAEPTPPPSAPVIRELVTRKVSNPSETAQPYSPPEPAVTAQADTTPPPEPAAEPAASPQVAPTVAPAREPVVASAPVASTENDTASTLRLLLLAIALTGFAACAGYFVLEMVRRRTDVLNRVKNAPDDFNDASDNSAFESSHDLPLDEEPTFAALPPMGVVDHADDVETTLRRVSARRRAA